MFASYRDDAVAKAALARVERELGIDAQLAGVTVDGVAYRRLVSEPVAGDEVADVISRAALAGFHGAWSTDPVVSTTGPAPADSVAMLPRVGEQRVVQSGTAKPAPGAMRVPAAPRTVAAPMPRATRPLNLARLRRVSGAAAAPSSDRNADRSADQAPAARGAIEIAHGDAILLPRFDAVDVRVDGLLDEGVWAQVPAHSDMTVISPDTLETPKYETRSRIFYTSEGFYVGMYAVQPVDTRIARLSSRDATVNRDGMQVTIDPSGTGLYGYYFGVNLGGSLDDGTVAPERSLSREWDGPWRGATAEVEDGWTAEIFVPWSTIPMPASEGVRAMGIYVARTVGHLDETWAWPARPFTQPRFLSALQPVQLEGVEPRQEYSFFTYSSAAFDRVNSREKVKAGVDFFWSPRPGLQVTAAVNPDFGNVEADDVVVNLSAFETFFPEKRLFFLEGVNVFETGSSARRGGSSRSSAPGRFSGVASGGFTFVSNRLVHMRRIGARPRRPDLPDDYSVDALELAEPADLLGAVKVTGQEGPIRYGVLAAFEDDTDFMATPDVAGNPRVRATSDGRDFAIIRGLWEGTAGGRKSVGVISTLASHPDRDASVFGIDMTRQSKNGKWDVGGILMTSDIKDEANGDSTGHGVQGTVIYRPRRGIFAGVGFDIFDDELNFNDFGFMRRNDFASIRGSLSFIGANKGPFRTISSSIFIANDFNIDGDYVDGRISNFNTFTFANRSSLRASISVNPSALDDRSARGNGMFRVEDRWGLDLRYESDPSRKLAFRAGLSGQQEDLGDWRGTVQVGLAYAPSDRISVVGLVDFVHNDGWLLYQGDRDFATFRAEQWQPKINTDIFFSAKQQLRISLQWAGVIADEQGRFVVPDRPGELMPVVRDPAASVNDFSISNLTLQIRYRWQIAPLSDVFVVYTRASNPDDLAALKDFGDIYERAFDNPLVEGLVVKVRYRFGN